MPRKYKYKKEKSLLDSDRQPYPIGGLARVASKKIVNFFTKGSKKKVDETLKKERGRTSGAVPEDEYFLSRYLDKAGDNSLTPVEIRIAQELYPTTSKSKGFQGHLIDEGLDLENATMLDVYNYLEGDLQKFNYFGDQVRNIREEIVDASSSTLRKQEDAMLRVDPDVDVENVPGRIKGDLEAVDPDLGEAYGQRGYTDWDIDPTDVTSFAKGGLLTSQEGGGVPLTERKARAKAFHRRRSERGSFQEGGVNLLVPPEQQDRMPISDVAPVDTYPNIPPGEEAKVEASQAPDDKMEEDYLEFIVDESLDDEEKTYLMSKLEDDPQLSQIFDKVVGTASEFSGEGEVKGPGTEVSDSIPARLSEGEFVFTNKATEQIGADELQTIMDDAERAYDGGLISKALGGLMSPLEEEIEGQDEEIKKTMISSNRMPSLR